MPLFQIAKENLQAVEQTNFDKEKKSLSLDRKNLGVVFNCRLVASEFLTGAQHAGRIDTLAISEDNNPVIIEYKKVQTELPKGFPQRVLDAILKGLSDSAKQLEAMPAT